MVCIYTEKESHGDMILHLAVRLASPLPLLQLLLRYDIGGGPVTPNNDGDTPISLAGKLRHFELLACLMQALRVPYFKTPDCPLRLSTNTYESPQVDDHSIKSSLSRSSWTSTPSSLHLSLLFGLEDMDEGEIEQVANVTSDVHIATNIRDSSLDFLINELLRDIVDEIISVIHPKRVDTESDFLTVVSPDIPSILPTLQQSSPCTTPLPQAKYHGSGRSRSLSLVSESDEWCVRGAAMDSSDEEVCRYRYFAPPPSLAASSHSPNSSDCTFSIAEKNDLFPMGEVDASAVDHSVKESDETAVSCKCSSGTKVNRSRSQDNESNEDDNDALFCCSPFLSPAQRGLSTRVSQMVVVSPCVTSPAAVSPLSVQPSSAVHGSSGRDEDYGLFVDLDVSQSTVSPQTKFNPPEIQTPNRDSLPSASESTTTTESTTKRRVFVLPRPLRKATGRLVRFMVPSFHKHK